jgi:hypothetical protein
MNTVHYFKKKYYNDFKKLHRGEWKDSSKKKNLKKILLLFQNYKLSNKSDFSELLTLLKKN